MKIARDKKIALVMVDEEGNIINPTSLSQTIYWEIARPEFTIKKTMVMVITLESLKNLLKVY